MSTIAPGGSNLALVNAIVVRGIGAIRGETIPTRGPRPVDSEWGRSESFDPDNVGDIADEGLGHRG